jgi:hypothetical protein
MKKKGKSKKKKKKENNNNKKKLGIKTSTSCICFSFCACPPYFSLVGSSSCAAIFVFCTTLKCFNAARMYI